MKKQNVTFLAGGQDKIETISALARHPGMAIIISQRIKNRLLSIKAAVEEPTFPAKKFPRRTIEMATEAANKSDVKMSSFSENNYGDQYTITSRAAIFSLFFGLLSVSAFLFQILVILAPIAIVIGFMGLRSCWKFPEEVKGAHFSYAAIALSAFVFVAAPAYHTFVYMHEVKDGYTRTTWYGDYKVQKGNRPYTKKSESLDGKKVFVKGYVRPGLKRTGMSEFLLVGDLSQCCFGGNPKISEIIYVKIKNGQKVDYSWRLRKIHGTFKLNKRLQKGEQVANDILGYVYEIEADEIL